MCAAPEGNDTTCEEFARTDLELHIHHDPNLGTERQQFKSILEIPRRHQNTQEYDVCPFVSVFSSFMASGCIIIIFILGPRRFIRCCSNMIM